MNLARLSSAVVIALYAGVAGWYVFQPAYLDQAEASMTAVAAAVAAGAPIYPQIEAAERYAHIYGPGFFLINAWALVAFGASIFTTKALAAVSAIASLGVTYATLARPFGRHRAAVATAATALAFLSFGHMSFWPRPEPLLILCAAVGVAGLVAHRAAAATVAVGVAAGIALNLKLTGVVYLLPALALLMSRHGVGAVLGSVAIASAAAVLPFTLANASAAAYVDYVHLSAANGLVWRQLARNGAWAALLIAPLTVCWWQNRHDAGRSRITLAVAVVGTSMLIVSAAAAKPGAGPYHLLPFVPLLAYVTLAALPRFPTRLEWAVLASVAVVLVAIMLPRQAVFLRTMVARDLDPAVLEVRSFAAAHPDVRFSVGHAGTSYLSQARVAAVFATGDYFIDASAVQEHRLSGLDVPPATLAAIRSCRMAYWLMPKDGAPFDVPSAYAPRGPARVFPPEFVEAFLAAYERTGETVTFDIWKCRER